MLHIKPAFFLQRVLKRNEANAYFQKPFSQSKTLQRNKLQGKNLANRLIFVDLFQKTSDSNLKEIILCQVPIEEFEPLRLYNNFLKDVRFLRKNFRDIGFQSP